MSCGALVHGAERVSNNSFDATCSRLGASRRTQQLHAPLGEAYRRRVGTVIFDQGGLRGGDVWDERIRRESHDGALFTRHFGNTASRREVFVSVVCRAAQRRDEPLESLDIEGLYHVGVQLSGTSIATTQLPQQRSCLSGRSSGLGERPAAAFMRVAKYSRRALLAGVSS